MRHVWIGGIVGTRFMEQQNSRSCVVRYQVKLPYFHDPPSDFIDIAWEIKNRWVGVNWDLFATTRGGLWNNENQVRHGGQCKSYEMIVKEAIEYLKEYQAANMCAEHHYTRQGGGHQNRAGTKLTQMELRLMISSAVASGWLLEMKGAK